MAILLPLDADGVFICFDGMTGCGEAKGTDAGVDKPLLPFCIRYRLWWTGAELDVGSTFAIPYNAAGQSRVSADSPVVNQKVFSISVVTDESNGWN